MRSKSSSAAGRAPRGLYLRVRGGRRTRAVGCVVLAEAAVRSTGAATHHRPRVEAMQHIIHLLLLLLLFAVLSVSAQGQGQGQGQGQEVVQEQGQEQVGIFCQLMIIACYQAGEQMSSSRTFFTSVLRHRCCTRWLQQ